MATDPSRNPVRTQRLAWASLAIYVALICYGSLYPATNWRAPEGSWWGFLLAPPPRFITRTDLATNLLAYIPLGLLMAMGLSGRMQLRYAIWYALAAGLLLSTLMECVQAFLPNRVASNLDILTNCAGVLLGALFYGILRHKRWPGRTLLAWRHRKFLPGTLANIGLLLLGIWAISQLSLGLPSLVAGNLRSGFTPFWQGVADLGTFRPIVMLVFALEILVVGMLLHALLKRPPRSLAAALLVLGSVIACKFLAAGALVKWSVLGKLLSLEAITGFLLGVVLLKHAWRRADSIGVLLATLAGAFGLAAARSLHSREENLLDFFLGLAPMPERLFNITGFAAFAAALWPYLAATFLALHWLAGDRRRVSPNPAR